MLTAVSRKVTEQTTNCPPAAVGSAPAATITQRVFHALLHPPRQSRPVSALIVVLVTAIIAWIYTASEGGFSRQAFYIIPMILAVSWLGLWWGISIALVSAVVRFYGAVNFEGVSIANSEDFYAALANRLSLLLVNIVIILILHQLYELNRELERRVQTRTAALRQAVEARERLQADLAEAGIRERGAIGRDLHDGLGQHLTATALAARVLSNRLAARSDPLAADARAVERLVQAGIEQTRHIARGILLESIRPEDLVPELEELAGQASHEHHLPCSVFADGETSRLDGRTATHLFYIAREAVRNTLRHSRAKKLSIHVQIQRTLATLLVTDDGCGIPPEAAARGVGLQIMAQRAELIGGRLTISPAPDGGTRIDCRVPLSAPA